MGKTSRARRLLPEEYRKAFANKQVVCVEYQDITDADEREIFQVCHGVPFLPSFSQRGPFIEGSTWNGSYTIRSAYYSTLLTDKRYQLTFFFQNLKEKLQVINSPRATFIRELQTAYLKEDGWLGGDSLDWDRSRGSDFRCISQAIFCMEKISGNLKGVTMLQLEKWLNLQDPFSSDFKSKISDSYRIFAELVQDRKLNKVFKKPVKVSPVEFTTIGLLVFVHKDTLTMAQLSEAIAKMRDDVRANYVDIRMNSRVMKTMIDFIKSLQIPKIPGDTGGPAGATGSMASLKRKRAEQQNESDDEEDDDDEKTEENPKAKKKPATVSNAKSLPSRERVKAEPVPSPVVPSKAPKPAPPDRMAAFRRAKDAISQQQHQGSALPTGPRVLSNNPNSSAEPNPQLLPSPGPSAFASQAGPSNSNRPPNSNSYQTPLPAPLPLSPSSVMENSLMASMMRSSAGASATPLHWHDSQQQQPSLSTNAGSSSSNRRSSYDKGSWDKNRDLELEREQRERERERDRDRNYTSGSSGRGGGRYHDHDDRYGSHRGSHGYGRSTDEWRR